MTGLAQPWEGEISAFGYVGVGIVMFVFTSFIKHRTGTALTDDNGRTLVTTAPRSRGREQLTTQF